MGEQKQSFKAVYFSDYKTVNPHAKGLILAFGERDKSLYKSLANHTSQEVRELLGTSSFIDLDKKAGQEGLPVNTYCLWLLRKKVSSEPSKIIGDPIKPIYTTFRGGKGNPLHGWYDYLEGYSPEYVDHILENYAPNASAVYDPFAGTGVTPLVAAQRGTTSYFSEVNPLLQFLVKTKIAAHMLDTKKRNLVLKNLNQTNSNLAKLMEKSDPDLEIDGAYKEIFRGSEFFDKGTYKLVLQARNLVDRVSYSSQLTSDLILVAILNSIIPSSLLERAGDVRFKTEKELKNKTDFILEISKNLSKIIKDVSGLEPLSTTPILISENAKSLDKILPLNIDTVITSPPYLNGTNYFRNTKVELWFLRSVKSKEDLAGFRRSTVTAGINDVSQKKETRFATHSVKTIVQRLEKNAYDSRIPKMVADYFQDIENIFSSLKSHFSKKGVVAIDIGDSIYGGVKVPTDELYIDVLGKLGYKLKDNIVLRKRISRNGELLKQSLLVFISPDKTRAVGSEAAWKNEWQKFKKELPHKDEPYAKRNWGHPLHSLCSYQGKMKPSLAHFLVKTFTKPGDTMLDPFGGVGTIPFEGALNGVRSLSFEISPPAIAISKAKLVMPDRADASSYVAKLSDYLESHELIPADLRGAKEFGFNKKIESYYEEKTLKEILIARRFFQSHPPEGPSQNLVLASMLHILHGNRPYALSRRSHGITPFAPTGEFIYKPIIKHIEDKLARSLGIEYPDTFTPGEMIFQDATSWWPRHVDSLDAVITSPPFFDSTRFYLANWIRLWFAGWNADDFKKKPLGFVDEKQKIDFTVYEPILRQSRERLKKNGVLVFHLGKSSKCDMAERLEMVSKKWFKTVDVFEENVEDTESHGIRDKGTVVKHQFLVLT